MVLIYLKIGEKIMVVKIKNKGNNIYYAIDDKHSIDSFNIIFEGSIIPTHIHTFEVNNLKCQVMIEVQSKHIKMGLLSVQDITFVYDTEKLFKGVKIANRIKLLQMTYKKLEQHFGSKVAQKVHNEVYIFAKRFSKEIMSGQLFLY